MRELCSLLIMKVYIHIERVELERLLREGRVSMHDVRCAAKRRVMSYPNWMLSPQIPQRPVKVADILDIYFGRRFRKRKRL